MISSSISLWSVPVLRFGSGLASVSSASRKRVLFGLGSFVGSLPPYVFCVRVGVPAGGPHLLPFGSPASFSFRHAGPAGRASQSEALASQAGGFGGFTPQLRPRSGKFLKIGI